MNCDKIIGFFHPYANGLGGGERVLFMAIKALEKEILDSNGKIRVVIYHGGDEPDEEILEAAFKRFNISIDEKVKLNFV